MRRLLLFCCFFYICVSVLCQTFTIPDATLEFLSPKGLKISIPATDEDVTLVAFHVNKNEQFFGVEHGQWAMDITRQHDGRWTYVIPDLRANKGDTIYYWVYAIRNGLGFQNLHQEYKVTHDPHVSAGPASTNPRDSHTCQTSDTVVQGRLTVCAGELIFNSTFRSDNDLKSWAHDVYIDPFNNEDAFMVYGKDRSNVRVSNNHLVLQPTLLEDKYSEGFVTNGSITLDGCTSEDLEKCSAKSNYWQIIPPVAGARLTSRNSFNFQFGVVEIKAKLPRGDWIVPDLTLEPTEAGAGSRIVVALARGNQQLSLAGHNMNNALLQAGVQINSSSHSLLHKPHHLHTGLWSNDFHVFKVVWAPDRLEFFVDNSAIGKLPSPIARRFTKECYISLGVHVGGRRDLDFPNGSVGRTPKPWKNTDPKAALNFWQKKGDWLPSWSSHSALMVEYVKVSALPVM